jgi:hypothetical protein
LQAKVSQTFKSASALIAQRAKSALASHAKPFAVTSAVGASVVRGLLDKLMIMIH